MATSVDGTEFLIQPLSCSRRAVGLAQIEAIAASLRVGCALL